MTKQQQSNLRCRTIFPKRKETSHSSVCLQQHDIGKVNRFFDIVLHYLCNKNLENNQPRSRKLKMRYLIPATKPRNIPNSAKASSFGMISSWGKILESIFTNKQSGGKGRGERPWREVEGFQGEEDWGSRRIKSFPLDPDTRQRQITRDLGVLGGSASSHTQRSFPTPGSSNESKGCCEEDAKIVCPSGTKGSGHHAREDAFSLPCSFREPVCALGWSTSCKRLYKRKNWFYTMLFTHSHSHSPSKNKALFFQNIFVYFMF